MIKQAPSSFKDAPVTPSDKLLYTRSFASELAAHAAKEEQVLVPAVRGLDVSLDQLLEEIVAEHGVLGERLAALDHMEHAADLASALDELGHMIEAHVRKEERILFEQIQVIVAETVLAELHIESL